LSLHHIDKDYLLENDIKKSKWNDIANLDCEEIINRIKEERCVSLCCNCHGMIHSDYRLYIEEIYSGIYPHEIIINLSNKVNNIYQNIIHSCKNFRFPIKYPDNISPLKINDVRKYKKDDKIEYILNNIYEIIERRAYNEFSVDDVATNSDFSYNTIYKHFENLLVPSGYITYEDNPFFIDISHNRKVYKMTKKGFECIEKEYLI